MALRNLLQHRSRSLRFLHDLHLLPRGPRSPPACHGPTNGLRLSNALHSIRHAPHRYTVRCVNCIRRIFLLTPRVTLVAASIGR
jgi:hypothetical protein